MDFRGCRWELQLKKQTVFHFSQSNFSGMQTSKLLKPTANMMEIVVNDIQPSCSAKFMCVGANEDTELPNFILDIIDTVIFASTKFRI